MRKTREVANIRKFFLAGMMGVSALSLAAPAYAQRGGHGRDGGQRGGWSGNGSGGGGRSNGGQRPAAPQAQIQTQAAPQAQPQFDRNARAAQAQARQAETMRNWQSAPQTRPDQRGDNRPGNGRPGNDGWRNDRNDGTSGSRWSSGTVGTRPDGGRPDDRRGWNGNDRPDNRPNDRNDGWRDGRPGQPSWNQGNWAYNNNRQRFNDRTRWNDQRRWDNGWRNDRRYDWQAYRSRYQYIYRPGPYYAPRGWGYGYRPFSIGVYLDSMWYSDGYWLDDPYRYRLPPAYGSMRWIRYYDDALLVDIRDGYVVDVIRNFFY